jgi:hypothetical protein
MEFSQVRPCAGACIYGPQDQGEVGSALPVTQNTYEATYNGGCLNPPEITSNVYLINSKIAEMDTALLSEYPPPWISRWGNYFAEFEIQLPPEIFNIAQNPDQYFMFGLAYYDEDYGNMLPIYTIPNDPANAMAGHPRWDVAPNWQRVDFRPGYSSKMSFGAWNVGQLPTDLPFVNNGGTGEPNTIGPAISNRDHVCLNEIYDEDDREWIFRHADRVRRKSGKHGYTMIQGVEDGDPPNEIILTSWIKVDSDYIKFMNAGGDLSNAPDDNGQVFFDNNAHTGAKGAVWARVAKPVFTCNQKISPNCEVLQETPSPTEWFDIFCAHTQASYDKDTSMDHHHQYWRDLQFPVLAAWIKKKREMQGPDGLSGMTRPALLMGDMNQVGPKSVVTNWDADGQIPGRGMSLWRSNGGMGDFSANTWNTALAEKYESMRRALDNWDTHYFDLYNPRNLKTYDLSSNTQRLGDSQDAQGEGTWIGTEGGATTWDKKSLQATPTYPDLRTIPRIDYIMVLPPDRDAYPSWKFVWDQSLAPRDRHAFVDRHYSDGFELLTPDGPVTVGRGTLSDHAEVTVQLEFVQSSETPGYNPNRPHRLVYSIGQLSDVFNNDESIGDDGETDWFIYEDWFHIFENGVQVEQNRNAGLGWFSNSCPGRKASQTSCAAIPWRIQSPVMNPGVPHDYHMVLKVADHDSGPDDIYDANPEVGRQAAELQFNSASLPLAINRLDGNGVGIAEQMSRFSPQGTADFHMSGGGGDGYIVDVHHFFWLCETSGLFPSDDNQCQPPFKGSKQ